MYYTPKFVINKKSTLIFTLVPLCATLRHYWGWFWLSFRNTIKSRISRLENINDYKYIYKLIKNKTNITINKNGVYFNLQSLDDETIEDLIDYLDDVL